LVALIAENVYEFDIHDEIVIWTDLVLPGCRWGQDLRLHYATSSRLPVFALRRK
jgi:hypothetical protein